MTAQTVLRPRLALAGLLLFAAAPAALAQTTGDGRADLPLWLLDPTYYSGRTFEKNAVMDGNEVGITAFNFGLLGGVGEIRGTWPLSQGTTGQNRASNYVGDVLPVVAAEVPVDVDGDGRVEPGEFVQHVVSTRGPGNRGINNAPGQQGVAWTFEPKPGFASDRVREDTDEPNDRLALSTDPLSWPDFWPDEPTWIDPATGRAQWNGFFGRDQFNADLESYFWADDNNDRELQTEFGFVPDSTRPGRGGMGLEMKVRGLQWSQFLAQDAVFWLYEVTNTSTTTYPRVAVGLVAGTLAGGDGDSDDDLAFFDQANRIVYSWDNDGRGNNGQDAGYVGYGFLESPGDAQNGIDDDGDGDPTTEQGRDVDGLPLIDPAVAGTDNTFASSDFAPRVLAAGDPLVLIGPDGRRTIEYVPDAGQVTVESQGRTLTVGVGTELAEATTQIASQTGELQTVVAKDKLDDDLDGLIDEDPQLHFERRAQAFTGEVVVLPALKYTNYVGFARATQARTASAEDSLRFGLRNPLIDEARDNGVDDDGDWSASSDDVGADGQAGTGDRGEGNGVPDAGEPNFDALDVDESDQVGLTSFFYFAPSNAFPVSDDENVWDGMTPGFFTTNEELAEQQAGGGVDGDFVFGSGYFRLEPGQTLRFTLALVFGTDLEDITTNAITIQEIYDRNYRFARPPERPNLRAVPGDGRVTLFWDAVSEESRDPILGDDFEGYRIYKATDPNFADAEEVTDAFGNSALRVPIAQFDRDNGVRGIYSSTDSRVRGVGYNLGSDTGLRYSFVDEDVDNGRAYYYAVTAYDRGSPDFFPAENNVPVSVRPDGSVVTGANVVEVTPNAGAAGFQAGSVSDRVDRVAGGATGDVFAEVLDPRDLPEGAVYTVRFEAEDGEADADADEFVVERAVGGETLTVARGDLDDAPSTVFDGVRLAFRNDETRVDQDASGFAEPDGLTETFQGVVNVAEWGFFGEARPFDYEVRFGEPGQSIGGFRLGTTLRAPTVAATATDFTVVNTTTGEPTPFAFLEGSATRNGRLDAYGEFIFLFDGEGDDRAPTYIVRGRQRGGEPTGAFPEEGDVFRLVTRKPFAERDAFRFTAEASRVDEDAAREALERVRVVPNPYIAAASWERPLPPTITSGRGERRIDFTHLPAGARVRVYNVRGALVWEGQHDGDIDDGTLSWDLRTREGLETAYGMYFYEVFAEDVGTKTGKLALIK